MSKLLASSAFAAIVPNILFVLVFVAAAVLLTIGMLGLH
jgi:hypothetical protein